MLGSAMICVFLGLMVLYLDLCLWELDFIAAHVCGSNLLEGFEWGVPCVTPLKALQIYVRNLFLSLSRRGLHREINGGTQPAPEVEIDEVSLHAEAESVNIPISQMDEAHESNGIQGSEASARTTDEDSEGEIRVRREDQKRNWRQNLATARARIAGSVKLRRWYGPLLHLSTHREGCTGRAESTYILMP